MKKKSIIGLLLFVFANAIFPQNSGGLSFLKIGFDARNVALGDVGVIAAEGVAASAYNPALLALSHNAQVAFTHNAWMNDEASELIGAKVDLFGLGFALNINSSTVKNIEVRERPGEAVATFNANYFSGGISAGFFISENISIGFGGKYIYESLFSEDASGFGFDAGVYYGNAIENLDISFAAQNFGSMNKLKEEKTELPASLVLGASYEIPENSDAFDAKAYLATRKYFNENTTHFNFGVEGQYKKMLYLRFGYQTGYEARSYSLGVGFSWRGFKIDYALAPFDYGLGNSHVIGVKYDF